MCVRNYNIFCIKNNKNVYNLSIKDVITIQYPYSAPAERQDRRGSCPGLHHFRGHVLFMAALNSIILFFELKIQVCVSQWRLLGFNIIIIGIPILKSESKNEL